MITREGQKEIFDFVLFDEETQERLMPDTSETLVKEIYDIAHRSLPEARDGWDDDFSLSMPGLARFRVNVFQQRGSLAAVIRVVNFGIPDWQKGRGRETRS